MANVDKAYGLRPVKRLDGAPYNAAVIQAVSTDSTILGVGDPVKPTGTADDDGVIAVTRCAAGDRILGVVVGVLPDTEASLKYKAASTTRYLEVCLAQNMVFAIQSTGTPAKTDVGLCADLNTVADASTATGVSTVELSGTMATGTAQCKILGLVRSPDNAFGSKADLLVVVNESHLADSVDGV